MYFNYTEKPQLNRWLKKRPLPIQALYEINVQIGQYKMQIAVRKPDCRLSYYLYCTGQRTVKYIEDITLWREDMNFMRQVYFAGCRVQVAG